MAHRALLGTGVARYQRVYLEISNICNLQCSFCPEVKRDAAAMSPTTFRAILAQVAPVTEEVLLHLMGEPLNHPEFASILAICAEVGTKVNLTTNGMLLRGDRPRLLLSPAIRQVNFSVHSFEANFPGQDARSYMNRVLRFTRDAMIVRPDLYINFRLWDFVDGRHASGANQQIRDAITQEFGIDLSALAIDIRRKKGHRLSGRVYAHFDSRFEWPSMSAPFLGYQGTCHGLGNHFGVHADGTVVPCCLDKEAVIALGNVTERPLDEILSSPRATEMRDGFANGYLTEELCRRCSFIRRFNRKRTSPRSFSRPATIAAHALATPT